MTNKACEKLFKEFDKDNSGFIDASEVRALLESMYKSLEMEVTEADVTDFVKAFDKSKDGKISYKEFVKNFERVTKIE